MGEHSTNTHCLMPSCALAAETCNPHMQISALTQSPEHIGESIRSEEQDCDPNAENYLNLDIMGALQILLKLVYLPCLKLAICTKSCYVVYRTSY